MSARNLPFFKFDTDSWLTGKIQLLTAAEKGMFIDLVARIWHENGSLKNDGILHRLLRVEKATLTEALNTFLELGIICENDGFLSVKFIDEQLSERNGFIEKMRACGAKGGRPQKGTKPNKKEERRIDIKEKNILKKENSETAKKSEFPTTVKEVLDLARSPQIGVPMSEKMAQDYLMARLSTDWIDGAGRAIRNVGYDIKRWYLRSEQQQRSAFNAPTVPQPYNPDEVSDCDEETFMAMCENFGI